MSLAAGLRLGPYEVINRIGAGGMGAIYRARDTALDCDAEVTAASRSAASVPRSGGKRSDVKVR